MSVDQISERVSGIIVAVAGGAVNASTAALAREYGRIGRAHIYGMPIADICAVINRAGEFWWYCLRATWEHGRGGDKQHFRERLAREIAEMPAGAAGLDYVVYIIPHLVFYARPHPELARSAMIGRLTIPTEYIWGK